jgi:NADH-quinone oxidoreductase subunit F
MPSSASTRKKGIDQSLCVKCAECVVACPPEYDAVRKVSPASLAPIIERPDKPVSEDNEDAATEGTPPEPGEGGA